MPRHQLTRRMVGVLLSVALLGAGSMARADGLKTYPISRFLTSRLNPFAGFGLTRFVYSRGLLGRIKAGTVGGNDQRSIRRILTAKGMHEAEADQRSHEIVAASRQGAFGGGPRYPISRFLSSRFARGVLAFITWSPGTFAHAATVGGLRALGVHLDRVFVTRGLTGRIAAGKSLMHSEQRLISAIAGDLGTLRALEGESFRARLTRPAYPAEPGYQAGPSYQAEPGYQGGPSHQAGPQAEPGYQPGSEGAEATYHQGADPTTGAASMTGAAPTTP